MNWSRLTVALTLPAAVALLLAVPCWLKRQYDVGSVLGAAVVLVAAVAAGGLEYVDAERACEAARAAHSLCATAGADFMRMAPYGIIAFAQVAGLFWMSLWLEERRTRREFDEAWR